MTSDRPTRKPAPRPFGPRTYEQPDLDSVPLNPKRWRYVLNLILARHAWRHSTRNKGVGYDTIAEHGRLIVWMFRFLREHPKRYRLDPRSFTGRHVDCVMGHWAQEVKAGRTVGRGVVDCEISADDEHRLGFHGDRASLMAASSRARERDDEHDQREPADGDGEEGAERGGEHGLKEIFHGMGKRERVTSE